MIEENITKMSGQEQFGKIERTWAKLEEVQGQVRVSGKKTARAEEQRWGCTLKAFVTSNGVSCQQTSGRMEQSTAKPSKSRPSLSLALILFYSLSVGFVLSQPLT